MTSQRISLSDSPSFAGTRSISADGDLYGLVSNEILILSSADGVLYETSFKRHNGNVHRAASNIIVSKSRAARDSVCSTPDMGVILWGVSPLYIVSVSLLKVIIPKCKRQ